MQGDGSTIPPQEWRPVVGYEGWYSVSSWGRVRRDVAGQNHPAGYILRPYFQQGYLRVSLRTGADGEPHSHAVHQLVALAFIGPRNGAAGINHLNGDKEDNRPENLEWATSKRNSEHAAENGLTAKGTRHGLAKLTEENIRDILTSLLSGAELARRLGVSKTQVSKIRRREVWTHIVVEN